jgi:EAL domain-containing protein (putative c-di-GMP-specific phosphodiesterase class I)
MPSRGRASTVAERQRRYRERLRASGNVRLDLIVPKQMADGLKRIADDAGVSPGEVLAGVIEDACRYRNMHELQQQVPTNA